MAVTLTDKSKALFIALARHAGNWNNQPLVDITKEQRGNLSDLKKQGLLHTETSDGCQFAHFTPAGRALAAELGHPLNPNND